MSFDYFYGPDDAEQYSFYRIPKRLITGDEFQETSTEAKLLYGLMLDRLQRELLFMRFLREMQNPRHGAGRKEDGAGVNLPFRYCFSGLSGNSNKEARSGSSRPSRPDSRVRPDGVYPPQSG